MQQKEIYLLIISASVTSLIFSISLVVILILYQKRQEAYRKEIAKIQVEIKEQTLKNISWEIHDNIGQILSTLSLYSHKIYNLAPPDLKPKIVELQDIVHRSITEVRVLSRVLNTDYIKSVGLIKSVQIELERFQRLSLLKTDLIIEGEPFFISDDKEVILLRILQEFFSNTIKHADATELIVKFLFKDSILELDVKDNGIGFEYGQESGSGILNMKNRAKLIGVFLNLESKLNQGTELKIIYKRKN